MTKSKHPSNRAERIKLKTKTSRLTKELLETARDMHESGVMTKAVYDKIKEPKLSPVHQLLAEKELLDEEGPGLQSNRDTD